MNTRMFSLALAAIVVTVAMTQTVFAQRPLQMTRADRVAARNAEYQSWHADYYHTQYGRPVALVVPPTANASTHWGWGVGGTRVLPIYHQFSRPYHGVTGPMGYPLRPTPTRPSDTDQFGVYYVRGPY